MKNANTVRDFLSLFNFHLDSYIDLDKRLSNMEYIVIKDKDHNVVGNLYMDQNGKILINAFLQDYCLYAIGNYFKRDNEYGFEFSLQIPNNEKKLQGSFKKQEISDKDDLVFYIDILAFENGKLVCEYKFNTIQNLFDITINNGSKINYHENILQYVRNGRNLLLKSDDGIFYNDINCDSKDLEQVCGGYDFTPVNNEGARLVEDEFNKVILEICPDYFDFVSDKKELLDTFSDELFENIIRLVYTDENSKKINSVTATNNIGYGKKMGRYRNKLK